MYTIYVSFICHDGKREAFVERMKSEGVLQAVREEDGCIRYDYYYADENPNELLLIEAWESKEHQQIHIGQPHMAKLREFRNDYIAESKLGEFELK